MLLFSYTLLEHNYFKNVSKWVIFLWKTQIQTIEYDPNDTKMIEKARYIDILLIYTLWYEFASLLVAQRDFGKEKFTKNLLA